MSDCDRGCHTIGSGFVDGVDPTCPVHQPGGLEDQKREMESRVTELENKVEDLERRVQRIEWRQS